ncbi:MAG: hypothetical protein QXT43_00630 [Candidatus Micrarchaeaceae archaeon]
MRIRSLFVLGFLLLLISGISGIAKAQPAANGQQVSGSNADPSVLTDIGNAIVGPLCTDLLNSAPNLGSSYSALLAISLLIVLAVLLVMSIAYAFGRAFGIPGLVELVKKEYIESIFNIFLIVAVVGGLGIADKAVSFLGNVAIASLGQSTPAVSVSSTSGLFGALCTNYLRNGIGYGITNIIYLLAPNIIDASILQQLTISVNYASTFTVTGFAYSYSPFSGIYPFVSIIGTEISAVYSLIAINLGISFLLGIIYDLFPLLFYLGILFRSFPWTRAAGGSLVALFISFFIVFPSILYAFSIIQTNTVTAQQTSGIIASSVFGASVLTSLLSNSYEFLASLYNFATSELQSILSGVNLATIFTEMKDFAGFFAYGVLQLLGLVIAVVVSFDLLEGLSDLLGAPSLEGSRLLQKVI